MDVNAVSIITKISAGVTTINAIACVIVVTVVYTALRPALKKAGLFGIISNQVISPKATAAK